MSNLEQDISLDSTAETLTVLAGHLEAFLAAWSEGGSPPALGDYLPESGELRRLTLIELIKADLEYRLEGDELPKRLTDYFAEFPELTASGVPADLVYEEFHIRKNAGLAVDPDEYVKAFPKQADELRCLLGLAEPYESTALVSERRMAALEELKPGQSLDEFELITRLGKGAFAHVFLARQTSMQRLVALKVSADHGTEPQTLAQLDHDYIVRVFDQRSLPEQDLRLLYMQYIAGGTLQSVVEERRQSPPDSGGGSVLIRSIDRELENRGESRPIDSSLRAKLDASNWGETVCWIGARLASALEYAHGRGILHRDIKPANVLVTSEGVPKLADFNISFSSKLDGASPAAYFGGSLAYMSPEQLEASSPAHERRPDSLDGRSDLYSLAVMLWELLTGHRPFADKKVEGGWTNTLNAMLERRYAGIDSEAESKVPPDCPPGLIRVLKKCLEPDREKRWKSGLELAQQLELCQHPRAQQLVNPEENSTSRRLRSWSVVALATAAILPHAGAGVFAYYYNLQTNFSETPAALDAFWWVVLVINSIAFPTAFACALVPLLLVRRAGKSVESDSIAPEKQRHAIRVCLNIGHIVAWIAMVEWTLAGFAYPITMQLVTGSMSAAGYANFIGSHVFCGAMAIPYSFFGVSYFCVWVLYPSLLQDGLLPKEDVPTLQRLISRSGFYLAAAGSLPFLGILAAQLLVDSGAKQLALTVFAVVGFCGFGAAFWIYRRMQRDVDTLVVAAGANV